MTTSQGWATGIEPRRRSTSRASMWYSSAIESLPLLLDGMAQSMCTSGESVSVKAIVGMLM